jgi:hypothetical protein
MVLVWYLSDPDLCVKYSHTIYIHCQTMTLTSSYLLLLSLLCTRGFGFQIPVKNSRFPSRLSPLCSTTTDDSSLDWNALSTARTSDEPQDFVQIENEGDDNSGNVNIPTGGFSVSDQIDFSQRDRFVTEVVPIEGLRGVAQLYTSPVNRGSFEPVRYLVATTPPPLPASIENPAATTTTTTTTTEYVLIDVPPFSPQLVAKMKAFMGSSSSIKALLITSRDNIHYDEMPAVFVTRRADLDQWKNAFPSMKIVSYRLDTPRDCRPLVSQVLDGYGPFAMLSNGTFVETGRPLTYAEWDANTTASILSGQQTIPKVSEQFVNEQADKYSIESIRNKEKDKLVLAIYTPGHTYGSVSYVFPQQSLVASGFTVPVEETRVEDNLGGDAMTGPAIDCRGYIATSRGGIRRQMESARRLVNEYIGRFSVVLPSRGDPLFLESDITARTAHMNEIIDQYDRIGQIYEQLGIVGSPDDI